MRQLEGLVRKVLETLQQFLSPLQFPLTIKTAECGAYYAPYLMPGMYQLTIEAQGFKTHVHDGIDLRINESPRLNVQLEIGRISDTMSAANPTAVAKIDAVQATNLLLKEKIRWSSMLRSGGRSTKREWR